MNKLEEDLLGIMEILEKVAAREQELQTAYDALQARHAADSPKAASDIAELSSGLDEARKRRDELAKTVDARLRRQYEMIFGRRRGLVVVEVRDGSCQGCHMRVAPQLYNDLQRNESVILCPSCHRILYWRPEPAVSEA
jgi:uncharacterized protein